MASDALSLFREGVISIRDHEAIDEGRKMLVESLRQDPHNEVAWLWLARTTLDTKRQLECVRRALNINPENQQALDFLVRLNAGESVALERDTVTHPYNPIKVVLEENTDDLGEVKLTSTPEMTSKFMTLVAFGLLGAAALPALEQAQSRLNLSPTAALVIGVAWVGVCVVVSLIKLIQLISRAGQRIELYEEGIAFYKGEQRRAARWHHITEVRFEDHVLPLPGLGTMIFALFKIYHYRVTVITKGEQQFHFGNDFRNCFDIAHAIKDRTLMRLLPPHEEALAKGEMLNFGHVSFDQLGLSWKGSLGQQRVDWKKVTGWSETLEHLTFKCKGSLVKQTLAMSGIPNGHVLRRLVNQRLG